MASAEAEIQLVAREKLPWLLRRAVRRELGRLPGLLDDDERVVSFARANTPSSGEVPRSGLLVVTDRRLMFLRERMGQLQQDDLRYEDISSVRGAGGQVAGDLAVVVSGITVTFEQVIPKERVQEITDYVSQKR